MKTLLLLLSLLLVPALHAGCDSAEGDGPVGAEANVVRGTVRTADGRALPHATVRVSDNSGAGQSQTIETTSGADGTYRVAVPPGHYNVDAFGTVEYGGQTYRGLWLDRTDGEAGCERKLSQDGIARDFVFRLTGLARCINNPDPNAAASYYGASVNALSFSFPHDAVITFTLVPRGPLADGSTGGTLTFVRTGAQLGVGGGAPLGQTADLHDIPLGRYEASARVRFGNGTERALRLRLRDGSNVEGEAVEFVFPARQMYPYGFQSVSLGLE
jgi:hypothetical protein